MYRNLYFGMALLMAGFALSCQTAKTAVQTEEPSQPPPVKPATAADKVVENSKGYKAENSETLKDRPQWVGIEEPPSKDSGPYYFHAGGEGSTIAEASNRAENEVKRRIASFILENTGFHADTDAGGARTVKSSNPSLETREEIEAYQYMETWIQSGASFANAELKNYFWERVQKGNADLIRYWVRYSITDETVAAIRQDLRNRDKNSIPAREAEEFDKLRTDMKTVLATLDTLSFLDNEDIYRKEYERLLIIDAQWKDLSSQRSIPDYNQKGSEMAAAIRYYDPTNSTVRIKQEQERLKIEQDIAKNERTLLEARYQGVSGFPAAPRTEALTVGSRRLQISGVITNREFLAFLEGVDKPDLSFRSRTPESPAVHVSWREAASYCNWLSVRSGLDAYYTISENSVQVNIGKSGYRLPSKEELAAGIDRAVINQATLADMGILGAESNRAYCFDLMAKTMRSIDGAFPTGNIGFMVVKNDK
jgi:hypothetical protein